MNLLSDLTRLEMIECVNQFGYCKGAEIFWLHCFINLAENRYKSRKQLEYEIVTRLRLPKLSKSTFDKTFALYSKIRPRLLTFENKEKLKMFVAD